MKKTIDLPDDLIRLAKLRAVAQGRALKDLVADCIRQGLGHLTTETAAPAATSHRVTAGPDGLPLIRCKASAPARVAAIKNLLVLDQRALAEDDLRQVGRHVRRPV